MKFKELKVGSELNLKFGTVIDQNKRETNFKQSEHISKQSTYASGQVFLETAAKSSKYYQIERTNQHNLISKSGLDSKFYKNFYENIVVTINCLKYPEGNAFQRFSNDFCALFAEDQHKQKINEKFDTRLNRFDREKILPMLLNDEFQLSPEAIKKYVVQTLKAQRNDIAANYKDRFIGVQKEYEQEQKQSKNKSSQFFFIKIIGKVKNIRTLVARHHKK